MGLTILHGEHAGDVIDACLAEICAEAVRWPQKRAFLIVPEQTKADMERRYLNVCRTVGADQASRALMLVDVVSFNRLAHRILSEVGGLPEDYLDDVSETMLIHRLLREGRSDFKVLSALADRVGFVPDVQSVLGDFLRYHVTPEKIRELDSDSLDPSFCAKMSDFALLMERMNKAVHGLGYRSQGDELRSMSDIFDRLLESGDNARKWPLNRLAFLRDTSVWILGFGQVRDFTPQEGAVIERLFRLCEKLTVSVCADFVPMQKGQISDGCAAFYFGRQTLWNLKEHYPGCALREVPASGSRNSALARLASSYARRSTVPFEGDASCVHTLLPKSGMDELHFVAGEIRRLVLAESYRYSDINVVLCNPAAYESNLHAVFTEYGLDPFLDKRRPLSDTVLVRFTLALLDLGISGWSFRPLMTCLKSGMCHITQDDADRLENYCLEHGLFRGERIFYEDNYSKRDDPDGAMFSLVRRVLSPIRDFLARIRSVPACADKAGVLLEFLNAYGGTGDGLPGIAGQVESLSAEWADAKDQDAAIALVASFNELVSLLRKMEGPIGKTEMSLVNFRNMLSAGLQAAFSGAIPSYVDQIQISDPRRGAHRSCRVLFLVGAERSVFPFKNVKEGYLRGSEREILAENLGIPFPSRSRDQVFADQYTAYSLLDSPADRLYLSCPITAEPSSFFGLAHDVFPNNRDLKNPPLTPHDPRLFSRSALQRYILRAIAPDGQEEDPRTRAVLSLLAEKYPELAPAGDIGMDASDVCIPVSQMDRRYGGIERMSVSQIETYATCPFRHFANYVLRLEERKVYETAANVVGTVLHSIFEHSMIEYRADIRTAHTAEQREEVRRKYLERDFDDWAGTLLKDTVAASDEPVTRDPAFLASDGRRIARTAAHSLRAIFREMAPGCFEPENMEWEFGSDSASPLQIRLPSGRSVLFRGVIDRVDLNEGDKEFRIVDYKSGNKQIDFSSLYHGLSVQLPAYLHAFAGEMPGWMPKDAGYFHLTSPMISFGDLSGKPDADSLCGQLDKLYRLRSLGLGKDDLELAGEYAMLKIDENCRALFAGEFPVAPRLLPGSSAVPACKYCQFLSVCGIDPARPKCLRLGEIPPSEGLDGKKQKAPENFRAAIRAVLAAQKTAGQKDEDGENG